jgi:hypothetical protein
MTGSVYETSHHHYHHDQQHCLPGQNKEAGLGGGCPAKALEEGEAYHEKFFCENVYICS